MEGVYDPGASVLSAEEHFMPRSQPTASSYSAKGYVTDFKSTDVKLK